MGNTRWLPLLTLALVAACVTEGTYQKEVKKSEGLESQNETYVKLNTALKGEVAADQVQIQQLQDRLKVTMVDQILFAEGGWEIGRKGEETLEKIIPTLKTLKGQRIEVEGFTDDVPIGPGIEEALPVELGAVHRAGHGRGPFPGREGCRSRDALRSRLWGYPAGRVERHRRGASQEPPHRDRAEVGQQLIGATPRFLGALSAWAAGWPLCWLFSAEEDGDAAAG